MLSLLIQASMCIIDFKMFCKFLNFPQVPVDLTDKLSVGEIIGTYPSRTCVREQQEFVVSGGIYYRTTQDINNWVKDNINVDLDFVGVRYQYGTPTQSAHGPHSDATRSWALLYTIDNADGKINFWQEKDQPLERERATLISDYDTLQNLAQYETPNGVWYLVNGQVIHSVEGMTRTRCTLQVNLKSLKGLK